jgi:hypothetical protein
MRALRILVAAGALLVLGALPAAAQSLEGGCTVSATSDVDSTTVVDATRSDPFAIDPEGSISWQATSPGAITDHTWSIAVEIGGLEVTVAEGSDPNAAGTTVSEGSRSIPELLDRVSAGVGKALLENVSGIFHVSGSISGQGAGPCSGDGWVEIEGGVLSGLLGQVAAGVAGLGALLTLVAGVGKKG